MRRRPVFIVALLLCAGCTTAARPPAPTCPVVPQLSLPAVQTQIATTLIRAVMMPTLPVVVTALGPGSRPGAEATQPAIVLDIDETSLSNWSAYRVNGWSRILGRPCDLERGPCGIRSWQATGRSAGARADACDGAPGAPARCGGVLHHRPAARSCARRPSAIYASRVTPGTAWSSAGGPANSTAPRLQGTGAASNRRAWLYDLLSMGDQQSDLDGGYADDVQAAESRLHAPLRGRTQRTPMTTKHTKGCSRFPTLRVLCGHRCSSCPLLIPCTPEAWGRSPPPGSLRRPQVRRVREVEEVEHRVGVGVARVRAGRSKRVSMKRRIEVWSSAGETKRSGEGETTTTGTRKP